MLAKLSIVNYALIDSLNVSFDTGFTVITGETGAGKSILLGGLSLVLGKRADLSSLRNADQKCVIEADFNVQDYDLMSFFDENDLDYEQTTVIRREILPSGKSRAFINDTPVNLELLSRLGNRLIDIHSQHQTLELTENDFQLKLIDALADNHQILKNYSLLFSDYKKTEMELDALVKKQNEANKEQDYNSFLLSELEAAGLRDGLLEELEGQYEELNNVEIITEQLSKGDQLLNDDQVGALQLVTELRQVLSKLSGFSAKYTALFDRIQSVLIELEDINMDLQALQGEVEADPGLLDEVSNKLQLLYSLQKKHGTQTMEALIEVRDALAEKVYETADLDRQIQEKTKALESLRNELNDVSAKITQRRKKGIPELRKQLESNLAALGMPNASFKIELSPSNVFKANGKDELTFLFAANKGSTYGLLKKVASGGELSRIMLVIKAILAKYVKLPTIMFDEIDTGVSGEISNKMAAIMLQMSKDMQVFSITHLPQVASRGNHHFKVFKTNDQHVTSTKMKKLNSEERVLELAQMLGGKDVSESALAHAKQLLS